MSNSLKKYSLVFFLFGCIGLAKGQRVILDSIIKEYQEYKANPTYRPDTLEVNYLVNIAKYAVTSNRDLALKSTNRADSLSHELQFKAGLASVMVMRARLNSMGSTGTNYEKAIRYTEEAEKMAFELGRMDIVFDAINNQAIAAYRLKDYEQAYESFQKGIKRAQSSKNATYLSHYQMNLGVIFTLLENHTVAQKYLSQSLVTHRTNPGYDGIFSYERLEATIISNLGYTYWKLGNYDQAKRLANESLKYFKSFKDESWISFANMILAGCLLEQDSIQKSLGYYKENISLEHFLKGDPRRLGQTYMGLGHTYKKLGLIDSASYAASKAHSIFERAELSNDMVQSASLMSSLFTEKQQIDSALYYQELSENITQDTRLQLINANLNLKETSREQQLLAQAQQNKKKRDQLRLLGLILFVLAVIILLFVVRSRMIAAQKNKNQLENLNHLKDQVFKFISQDLAVPMQTLDKVAALAQNEEELPDLKQYLPELKVNIDHSNFVLTNFHFWTQAHKNIQGKIEQSIDLNNDFDRIFNSLKFYSDRNQITVNKDIEQSDKLLWDQIHFAQVLENLLCNAVRFTPKDGLIDVKGQVKGDYYELSLVNDNQDFTIDRFEQAVDLYTLYREPSTEGALGAGIGLSVSDYLSKQNNSELFFRNSTPGKVEIVLRIPLAKG